MGLANSAASLCDFQPHMYALRYMLINRAIELSCKPEKCLSEVKTSRLLQYVSWPFVCFKAVEPEVLPEVWKENNYIVKIRAFCFIPFGRQNINISGQDLTEEKGKFYVELRDNGYGTLISKWDHRITIYSIDGGCLYSDRVEIKAGVLTLLVAAFAWFFYRHRQKRWKKLVARNFEYI